MRHVDPSYNVEAVKPAHLHCTAFGISVIMQVRHKNVISEIVPVHPHKIEETDVVVGITVYHDRRTAGICRIGGSRPDGVQPAPSLAHYRSVTECLAGVERIVPGNDARITFLRLCAVTFDIVAVFFRKKGIIAHIVADNTGTCKHCKCQGGHKTAGKLFQSSNHRCKYSKTFTIFTPTKAMLDGKLRIH